ncbi:MAG: porin [Proteobacteria bacterium]|nr:porin [Pseudomonadota bacterium]
MARIKAITCAALAVMIQQFPQGRALAGDLKPSLPGQAEPLRACPEYGPGFIRLPGTDVCLKTTIDLIAEVRADMAEKDLYIETTRVLGNPVAFYDKLKFDRDADRTTSRVDPRMGFMTVTKVIETPLITYFSWRFSPTLTAANARGGERFDHTAHVDQAWIKAAGYTAGRHPSFFDFSPGYTYMGGYASQRTLNLFAYTHLFGKSGSLSVSVEDANERRTADGVWSAYAGQRMPDIVAQARYLPSWGIIHGSAALHQINDGLTAKTGYGYALSSGVEYRQKWADLFGPGTTDTYGRFLLSGAYTRGALDYLGIPRFGTDYVVDVDGRMEQTKGFSAVFSYEHIWRPNFKTTLSYSVFNVSSKVPDFEFHARGSVAQVGAEYMPVPGLMIGAELDYYRDSVRGTFFGAPGTRDTVGNFVGMAYMRRRI